MTAAGSRPPGGGALRISGAGPGAAQAQVPRGLPPEAARWLAVDLGSLPAQVVVAGVTGGAGATTLTALVARSLATYRTPVRPRPAVAVLDHDGGTVHERSGAPVVGAQAAGARRDGVSFSPVTDALEAPEPVDADLVLRCLGAQALNPGPTLLDDPAVVAVVVAPWHPDGLALAESAVSRLGAARTVVVPVDVTHVSRAARPGLGVPWDRALTAPGEVDERALATATRRAVLAVTVEVLAAARRVAVLSAG